MWLFGKDEEEQQRKPRWMQVRCKVRKSAETRMLNGRCDKLVGEVESDKLVGEFESDKLVGEFIRNLFWGRVCVFLSISGQCLLRIPWLIQITLNKDEIGLLNKRFCLINDTHSPNKDQIKILPELWILMLTAEKTEKSEFKAFITPVQAHVTEMTETKAQVQLFSFPIIIRS